MSDKPVKLGQDGKPHFFMNFCNRAQKEKAVYSVAGADKPLNEKANEGWVVAITVKGCEYSAGPMATKSEAKEAAAEKALNALGWT